MHAIGGAVAAAVAVADLVRAASPQPFVATSRHRPPDYRSRDPVPIARFLRVVAFQPSGLEAPVDAVLREAIVPRLLERDEIIDAWIGRQGSSTDRSRIVASTWAEEPGPEPADLAALHDAGLHGGPPVVGQVDQLALAVHARFERTEPARILRVFRGAVRADEIDAYIAEARAGMAADAETNDGLIAFALGTEAPGAFVTISAWTGWAAIEAATGGNTRQPFATRNATRLTASSVAHYEVLPETPTRRGGSGGGAARGT
jgi:hypothetical protein